MHTTYYNQSYLARALNCGSLEMEKIVYDNILVSTIYNHGITNNTPDCWSVPFYD